jgi:hypothetical protein
MRLLRLLTCSSSALALVLAAACAPAAHADTVDWTTWTSETPGTPSGTATGNINGAITVTYTGQFSGYATGTSWDPTSTFTGGVVGNQPPPDVGIAMEGTTPGTPVITETITFSQVVADPIFAVWSLGAGGTPASFDFTSSEPFTVQGGGPSNEYGGTALTISGEDVEGQEGNGIIQFNGDFSSITFTTPQYENYYAFTVGEDQTLTSQLPSGPATTPEPATFSLLGLGLAALPFVRARLSRSRA